MACPHVSGGATLLLEADPILNRDQIMESLLGNGRQGFISGLMRNDPNTFLWSGAVVAPTDSKIVLFKEGTTDGEIREFCDGQCSWMGHPDAGGVAFAQMDGSAGANPLPSGSGACWCAPASLHWQGSDHLRPGHWCEIQPQRLRRSCFRRPRPDLKPGC